MAVGQNLKEPLFRVLTLLDPAGIVFFEGFLGVHKKCWGFDPFL